MSMAAVETAQSIETLVRAVEGYLSPDDAELLRRAYALAFRAHDGQVRDTGAPYIEHPLHVAHTLAALRCDTPTVAAGLLHDVVEDTSVELPTIRDQFGAEVAGIVDGVTKLSQTEFLRRQMQEENDNGTPSRAEAPSQKLQERAANIRKLFTSMTTDVRVMFVKLADRLHNMMTLEGLPAAKQRRVAEETIQVFAPLAHRLGIWYLKWQLEDLSFRYLQPEEHARLSQALQSTRVEREADVEEMKALLKQKLDEAGISGEVFGRAKHLYSIWNKLRSQELSLDQIYDLIALRIIVNDVGDCYRALGLVHQLWMPIPDLFSDYIARPKPNGYQSLHTKVVALRGEPIEVQIRTWEMHKVADFGIAAHWSYKEGARADRAIEQKLAWLRNQMLDWNSDSSNDTDYLDSVIHDLLGDQVFVFTPQGDVIDLPKGSGPIDFAFRIHSALGLRCTGARVNGKLVPLTYAFKSGDRVEIQTRPSAQPSSDWLRIVKTSHARSRIQAYFRKQRHAENVTRGRELVEKELSRLGLDTRELLREERLSPIAKQMNYQGVDDLLAGVGHGHVAAASIASRLHTTDAPRPEVVLGRAMTPNAMRLEANGFDDLYVRRSRCCLPVPGEEVIGYVTRGKGMALHRVGCPNLRDAIINEPHRLQAVTWTPTTEPAEEDREEKFSTLLRIETLDRVGVAAAVTGAFSERKVNIEHADVRTLADGTAVWHVTASVRSLDDLEHMVRRLQSVPDVVAVSRPNSRESGSHIDDAPRH